MSATYQVSPLDLIEAQVDQMRDKAKELLATVNILNDETARLKKENARLWDSIHEKDEIMREKDETIVELRMMLERAIAYGDR